MTAAMMRQGGTTKLAPEEFDQQADFLAAIVSSSAGADLGLGGARRHHAGARPWPRSLLRDGAQPALRRRAARGSEEHRARGDEAEERRRRRHRRPRVGFPLPRRETLRLAPHDRGRPRGDHARQADRFPPPHVGSGASRRRCLRRRRHAEDPGRPAQAPRRLEGRRAQGALAASRIRSSRRRPDSSTSRRTFPRAR